MAGDDNSSKQSGGGDTTSDSFNPYFLASNAGPENVITPIVFHGNNYEEWCRSIRLSLIARRKFEFIEGTIPKPTDEKGIRDWRCLQAMLVQWILNTVDMSIKKTLPHFEEAKPLWDVLRQRFNIGNGPRKQQIKAAIAECRQPKTMSIADYFGQLQPLWDELATYNPMPICKCGGCKCDIGAQLQLRMDEDRLQDFLFGVNTELYGYMRSSILSQDPLPSLDRAYQMFLQEERLQLAAKTQFDRDEVRALAVKGMPDTRMSDGVHKSNLLCTYCQRKGHEEATCWTKNGYPEWWEHRAPRGGGRGSHRGARHPRFNGQHIERTASRGKTEATVAAISSGVGDSSTDVISGMTNTQWQKLIDLLGNSY